MFLEQFHHHPQFILIFTGCEQLLHCALCEKSVHQQHTVFTMHAVCFEYTLLLPAQHQFVVWNWDTSLSSTLLYVSTRGSFGSLRKEM